MATRKTAAPKKAAPKAKAAPKPKAPKIALKAVSPGVEVTERGEIYFLYRPDAGQEHPGGLVDVRRFQLVLRPEGSDLRRLIAVGRKTLPTAAEGGGSHWAFVDGAFRGGDALRDALMGTSSPEARPAGEGVYAIARHGRSTVLAYALELPEEPGEVQRAFGIEKGGHFALSIKNPEAGSPDQVGLDAGKRVEFPEELQGRFGGRRWSPADPPAFLDHEGAELVLIAGRDDDGGGLELGLDPQPEDEASSEVFGDLHLAKSERARRPLFDGEWA